MNKNDLIDAIAIDTGVKKSDVKKIVDSYTKTIRVELRKGGKVTIIDHGTYSVYTRKATTGTNPRDGSKIFIPAKNVAKFKPGKSINDALND